MNVDILAIGAHPDDIELSSGATVARMVQLGHAVALADLTQGALGTRGTKEIRAREAEEAAGILGVKTRRNLKIADGNIEVNQANLHKVVSLIRELRPSILIIPHSFDRHPDHTHAQAATAWLNGYLQSNAVNLGEIGGIKADCVPNLMKAVVGAKYIILSWR